MAARKVKNSIIDPIALCEEWLKQLTELVTDVKNWSEDFGWSTRQITKPMKDSRLGTYQAPALLMQKATARVLLDPVARFTPGTDGIVDLYLMPAYDNIFGLFLVAGEWQLHSLSACESVGVAFSKDVLGRVLATMLAQAAESR